MPGYLISGDNQFASEIPLLPAGNIEANNIQDAINELDTEKADDSSVTTALSTKADSSTVTSELALKAPIDSPSFTGSVSLPENTTINGQLSTIQAQIDSKNNQIKFCEISTVDPLNAANGTQFSIPFETLQKNQGGFSLNSGSLIFPESGFYEINLLFESSISNSAYFIRAAHFSPKINGVNVSKNGSRYFNVPKTWSNTHYTFNDLYFVNVNANDSLSLTFAIYHNKGSNITETYWFNAYIKSLG